YLLFKKKLTASLFVIIPAVVALTAFSSGFIALVLVDHYLIDPQAPFIPLGGKLIRDVVGQIKLVVLGFTLLGLLAGAGIAYAILHPLRRIIAEARQIAEGDLTARLDIENLDELGILGKDFNKMVSSLNRYFIDSMAGGWILFNREGRIVSVNPGALNILGYDQEELVGQSLDRFCRLLKVKEEFAERLKDAVFNQKVFSEQEMEIMSGESRTITLALSSTLLKDKDDLFVGVAATIKDLGRARELTEQMQRTDKLAALGGMAAALAHEIRNPLGSIRGLTQLLNEEFREGEKGRTYTQTMIQEIDRLNAVVSNLLNFAQPTRREFQSCRINDLLEQAVAISQLEMEKKEVKLIKNLSPSLPPVWAESKQLVQAFLNLFLNAAYAVDKGGEIRIGSEFDPNRFVKQKKEARGGVVVKIRNTGSPIDPSIEEHIFDPFFTTKEEGTGLGLAITHQIVAMNGGTIDLSRDDGLTVFTLSFPAMAEGSPQDEGSHPLAPASKNDS
ncbi:MAG: ATP-binding protein, partial [Nitrospinaceae bacterium]